MSCSAPPAAVPGPRPRRHGRRGRASARRAPGAYFANSPPGRPPGAGDPRRPRPGARRPADRHLLRRPPVGHLRRPAVRAAGRAGQRAAAGRRGDRRRPGGRRRRASCARRSAPLADLVSEQGVFFVTGNHEYFVDTHAWLRHLPTLGVDVLRNERVAIRRGGGVVRPGRHRRPDGGVVRACPGTAPTSTPRSTAGTTRRRSSCWPTSRCMVEQARAAGVDLQLSGHTHGGQLWPFDYAIRLDQPVGRGAVPARGHPALRHVGRRATGARRCGSAPGRRSPSWSCALPGA